MRAGPVLVVLVAAGCSARSGGALPHARPLGDVGSPEAVGAPRTAEPGPAIEGLSRARFFRGLEHVAAPLPDLARRAAPLGTDPDVEEVPSTVRASRERFLAAGIRPPRILLAQGFSARLSKPPKACVETLLDAEVLRRSLDADEARSLGAPGLGAPPFRTYSVALLDRGKGPFRYDFRWSFRTHRHDLPGGAILLRYDLLPTPAPERVSAFQGVLVLEPDGSGTRLSEVLVLGTDISLPFFLIGQAGAGVRKILTIRAIRLCRRLR